MACGFASGGDGGNVSVTSIKTADVSTPSSAARAVESVLDAVTILDSATCRCWPIGTMHVPVMVMEMSVKVGGLTVTERPRSKLSAAPRSITVALMVSVNESV